MRCDSENNHNNHYEPSVQGDWTVGGYEHCRPDPAEYERASRDNSVL